MHTLCLTHVMDTFLSHYGPLHNNIEDVCACVCVHVCVCVCMCVYLLSKDGAIVSTHAGVYDRAPDSREHIFLQ